MGRTIVAAALLLAAGCADPPADFSYATGDLSMVFPTVTESNKEVAVPISDLTFTRADGGEVRLDDLAAGKPVVLVITRGQTDPICPACTTQTARLIKSYPDFVSAGAEVVVVYPKREESDGRVFEEFLGVVSARLSEPDVSVPFPIVFDVGLKAVRSLDIEMDLAKPTTIILDADRNVRFAFVGESITQRPSVESMLQQVRGLTGSPEGESA